MKATPYIHRADLEPNDASLKPLLNLAADQHLLACISTTESGMTFTLYDPETMPRSPTIWGVKEPHRLHAYWRGSDNDDPLIA